MACWKTDENDEGDLYRKINKKWNEEENTEAIYIDLEHEEQREESKTYSEWSNLPDLLLEKIFAYLNIREKYYASIVCRSWYRAFHLPYVWSHFVLTDNTLTRGRFNYYSGWQYVLDHLRTQMCLSQVGRNFRSLTFEPMLNFYNLYEFMNLVSWCSEQYAKTDKPELAVGRNIRTLKFTFPCNMTNRDDAERVRLFGTGGKLLAALKRLMANLRRLRRLELVDLMLDPKEAQYLLDEVCDTCCATLRMLSVVNATRIQYQMLHVGAFIGLQTLIIGPQNLGDDVIELLGYNGNLRHLHIYQNRYTANDVNIKPVSVRAWRNCAKSNRKLMVHLELESMKEKPLIWQEGAPVKSIVYDSPHIGLRLDHLMTAIEFYSKTLRIYGHKNVPRFHQPKSFKERIDTHLLMLVRECPYITTLAITERISTSTVLLLAYSAKNLRRLYVRGNAVILRCDWPKHIDWSDEFYDWLKINSRSYTMVEREVTQILGKKWEFLTDKQFKRLQFDLHVDY